MSKLSHRYINRQSKDSHLHKRYYSLAGNYQASIIVETLEIKRKLQSSKSKDKPVISTDYGIRKSSLGDNNNNNKLRSSARDPHRTSLSISTGRRVQMPRATVRETDWRYNIIQITRVYELIKSLKDLQQQEDKMMNTNPFYKIQKKRAGQATSSRVFTIVSQCQQRKAGKERIKTEGDSRGTHRQNWNHSKRRPQILQNTPQVMAALQTKPLESILTTECQDLVTRAKSETVTYYEIKKYYQQKYGTEAAPIVQQSQQNLMKKDTTKRDAINEDEQGKQIQVLPSRRNNSRLFQPVKTTTRKTLRQSDRSKVII